ncbi:MAG TPA: hypothetical protein VIY49_34195 [Bryobacteraceae bacterium]
MAGNRKLSQHKGEHRDRNYTPGKDAVMASAYVEAAQLTYTLTRPDVYNTIMAIPGICGCSKTNWESINRKEWTPTITTAVQNNRHQEKTGLIRLEFFGL